MADELTVKAGLTYTVSGSTLSMTPADDKVTISANYALRQIHTVTTVGENLPVGSVATPGFCLIRNTDGANYILVGNSGDTLPIKIEAGEHVVFRWAAGITPYAIANVANVDIEIMLVSD